jgi:D-alanyl-lipoteichoic acid acyltransferase DltB (MBOAT superfamily)
MLFHTFTFWTFFAIVASLYAMLRHRAQNALLLVAGYVFYGWWDWRFLILIALSTVVDFFVGGRIHTGSDETTRKRWLIVSLVFNIGLLGVFKYLGFAVAQLGSLAQLVGYSGPWWVPHVILPVGISFYTFQSLAYTIDLYRRRIEPAQSLFDYATYVSFFPQLLAGPIERPSHLLGQVQSPRGPLTDQRLSEGLCLIVTGLFRKIIIADNFALIASSIFGQPAEQLSAWEVLAGVYAFAFQIYGDFSGYSSIAQGLARWLGFELMDNFKQPYFALSPKDFWSRWHISLSTWLRDYLYIPLGGNRGSSWFTGRNLMITMLIGGLWHGANWTFIAWGAVHGAWLVAHRAVADAAWLKRVPSVVKLVVTFHIVCVTWLLFRAESMTQAWGMALRLFQDWRWTSLSAYTLVMVLLLAGPLMLLEAWIERRGGVLAITRSPWLARALIYLALLLAILYFAPERTSEFIYFQF